ncbi:stage II sporulation protein M [Shouchella sp. JSM 1781072]|uniref:stage II sporulation protein M n=1 Tax=Shouchella sp. JSM 1781072 TaxID=3344581 RepID=UPI0035BF63CC
MFKRAGYFFLFTLIVIFITFIVAAFVSPDFESLFGSLASGGSESDHSQWERFWLYVVNNGVYVPMQMFLFALIPIPFLYVFNLVSTSISVGLVLYLPMALRSEELVFSDILMGIVPHIFVEFLGFCLVASLLYQLNRSITRWLTNLFRKEKKEQVSIWKNMKMFFLGYLVLVLPVLVFAAVIEAFITPLLV